MDAVSGDTLHFVKFRPLLRFPKFLLVRDSTRFLLYKNLRFDEPDFCFAKTGSLSRGRQKVTASFMDAVSGDTLHFVKFRPLLRFPKFLLVRDSTRFLLRKNGFIIPRKAKSNGILYGCRIRGYSALRKISTAVAVPEIFTRSRLHSIFALQKSSLRRTRFLLRKNGFIIPRKPKSNGILYGCRYFLACPMGFEPTTFRVGV